MASFLQGDVLESVVDRVPLVDLVPASMVSKSWRSATRFAVRRRPRRAPWLLLVRLHGHRRGAVDVHAYDPVGDVWLELPLAGAGVGDGVRFARGCGGDRLCRLSFAKLGVAGDPLGGAWREEKGPAVWRAEAAVALAGARAVAVGGGFDMALEDGEEVGAVEVVVGVDGGTNRWEVCQALPAEFGELAAAAAATRLSVAASERRVYVVEKKTGVASWFDVELRQWGPIHHLRSWSAGGDVANWAVAVGGGGERLVVFGLKKDPKTGKAVIKIWDVDGDTLAGLDLAEEMPPEMARRLFPAAEADGSGDAWLPLAASSMEVCGTEGGGYVCNAAYMANGAVMYELRSPAAIGVGGRGKVVERWEWVHCPEALRWAPSVSVIAGCSPVRFEDFAANAISR